jgi:hypothetical protein
VTDSLADAVTVFRGNPFTDNAVANRARLGRLLLNPSATRAFRGAQRGSQPSGDSGDEHLVIAMAHARACALSDPKAVLAHDIVPDRVLAALPRSRQDYVRIALAAARCFRALQALPGSSHTMARLRRDAWTRAFGGSLVEALDTELLRRGQPLVVCGEPGSGRRAVALAILCGLPARSIRPPWIVPKVVDWSPSIPRPGADGLIVEGLQARPQDQLRALERSLGKTGGPRLAVICAPWDSVRPVLSPGFASRLAGLHLAVPTVRDRPEDLPAIAVSWLVKWGRELRAVGGPGIDFDRVLGWFSRPEVQRYRWPGNQAEVSTTVRSLILGTKPSLHRVRTRGPGSADESMPEGLAEGVWSDRQVRDWYIHRVHRLTGRIGRTAEILALDRSTVRTRLRVSAVG